MILNISQIYRLFGYQLFSHSPWEETGTLIQRDMRPGRKPTQIPTKKPATRKRTCVPRQLDYLFSALS